MLHTASLTRTSVISALLLLLIVSAIAYYPSLDVPFYLDDRGSITENTLLAEPSVKGIYDSHLKSRFIGYASLWMNYQLGELEPFGYHLVNIAIHLLNGLLVYWMVLNLFNFFVKSAERHENTLKRNRYWAFAVAALWCLHPLNSQTVIYIVQRLASIVAIFSLFTIIFYIKARQAQTLNQATLFGSLVLLCVIAGFHAKQNYATVIAFLYCWELYSAKPAFRARLVQLSVAGFIALLLIAPFIPKFWQALDTFTRDAHADTRVEYFYTQMVVLWHYLFKFFYPFNLQLEIGIELKRSFEPVVALAMVGHLLLIYLALRARRAIPLLPVGVLLFYCSHLVESFMIPIKDLAFEHRTYIGNVGLALALVAAVRFWYNAARRSNRNIKLSGAFALVCVVFVAATFLRAQQWQAPLSFYANEVANAPEHARANASYGTELAKAGKLEEAEKYLKKSFDISKKAKRITASALSAYMAVLYQQKKFQQGAMVANVGLVHIKTPMERSDLLSKLAMGYIYMGYCDFATGLLTQSLKLNPNNAEAKSNLAHCRR